MHIQYTHRLLKRKFRSLSKKQYITLCTLKGRPLML